MVWGRGFAPVFLGDKKIFEMEKNKNQTVQTVGNVGSKN